MKKSVFSTILALMAIIVLLQSCKDDENENPEFVADDSSFSNFESWTLEAENQGPDPSLGMAHAGNNETVTRKIYFKDGQDPDDGEFPVGTIIVKHSSNPDQSVNEFTAMVKRGNDFNPEGSDWEWFMLNADGSIATDPDSGIKMRGANLMNGMCLSCHSAGSTDYTFTK